MKRAVYDLTLSEHFSRLQRCRSDEYSFIVAAPAHSHIPLLSASYIGKKWPRLLPNASGARRGEISKQSKRGPPKGICRDEI